MNRLARLMPTCREMSRLLSDAMDRTLPIHVRLRMRVHLLTCVLCEQYKHQLTLIRNVLRHKDTRLADNDHPQQPGLSAEAKERIRRALESHRT